MDKDTEFAEKIKSLRKSANLTMAEFARKIGVSEGTVSLWESGKTIPRKTTIALIDKVFTVKEFEKPHIIRPSLDLIKEVIQTVEEIFQKNKLYLPPQKKAELIVLLYEEVLDGEAKKENLESRILRLVKLAS